MTDPYQAPGANIAEEPRVTREPSGRWLAWLASALCLLPIGLCLEIGFDLWAEAPGFDPIFLSVIALMGLPWLATGALLAMRRKLALWPMLFPITLAISMWLIGSRHGEVRFASLALGYSLSMLAIVLWLRKRRALT